MPSLFESTRAAASFGVRAISPFSFSLAAALVLLKKWYNVWRGYSLLRNAGNNPYSLLISRKKKRPMPRGYYTNIILWTFFFTTIAIGLLLAGKPSPDRDDDKPALFEKREYGNKNRFK